MSGTDGSRLRMTEMPDIYEADAGRCSSTSLGQTGNRFCQAPLLSNRLRHRIHEMLEIVSDIPSFH